MRDHHFFNFRILCSEKERESVCVCVCVCEREREIERENEGRRERERETITLQKQHLKIVYCVPTILIELMYAVIIADLTRRHAACDRGGGASINCGVWSADTTTESCWGSVERTGVGHRRLSRLTAGVQVSSTLRSMQILEALWKTIIFI